MFELENWGLLNLFYNLLNPIWRTHGCMAAINCPDSFHEMLMVIKKTNTVNCMKPPNIDNTTDSGTNNVAHFLSFAAISSKVDSFSAHMAASILSSSEVLSQDCHAWNSTAYDPYRLVHTLTPGSFERKKDNLSNDTKDCMDVFTRLDGK